KKKKKKERLEENNTEYFRVGKGLSAAVQQYSLVRYGTVQYSTPPDWARNFTLISDLHDFITDTFQSLTCPTAISWDTSKLRRHVATSLRTKIPSSFDGLADDAGHDGVNI
ncbi:hypothetical protein TWF569_000774, partial [Orbilia oligospora]